MLLVLRLQLLRDLGGPETSAHAPSKGRGGPGGGGSGREAQMEIVEYLCLRLQMIKLGQRGMGGNKQREDLEGGQLCSRSGASWPPSVMGEEIVSLGLTRTHPHTRTRTHARTHIHRHPLQTHLELEGGHLVPHPGLVLLHRITRLGVPSGVGRERGRQNKNS